MTNSGTIDTRGTNAEGVFGLTYDRNADISVTNTGDILTRGFDAEGMNLTTFGPASSINVNNTGQVTTTGFAAEGIYATTNWRNSDITITNSGEVLAKGAFADGIYALTGVYGPGRSSEITINNSGSIRAEGRFAYGITAVSLRPGSEITVNNSGELFGSTAAVYSYSATSTTINNSGDISAGSGLAIDTAGASTSINNSGLITGFVDLTRSSDTFTNMAGGEFNARDTSRFRGGSDLFLNEAGGTLRTANKFGTNEDTRFTGLERFQNKGLITMVDGKTGDSFTMSNTPGGTDLKFSGSGKSTLGVDAFLGGPGSKSDTLTVEGTTTGRTRLRVNNVNPGPGQLNRQGIPVVFVDGNVNASNFYLDKPIDAGFFDYDLVFTPTGSGRFDLKSHAGGGSHILPHVITATHEVFHQSTETWFDQTVDLRAVLARGSVCDDIYNPQERIRCQDLYDLVPAVWARGGGTWLDLDDNGTTKANGRTYRYDLGRDLDIWQVESGVDFGKEDIFSPDDMLVFGVLGGAVESSLEYDAIARSFEISTLEAGAYATYLRGGFFFDTLFKAFFGTVEPTASVEYPETLDTQTYGLRMDSGYRFGGLKDGPFVEPLGTIAVSWTHVDDFAHQGNSIDFADDEQVRGRLGLRMGTSSQIWEGTTFEPFVTGSFWGLLSGEHSATLTSRGTDFVFTDKPDEVWGEVSGGVNFFNPEAQTAVFAKIDYIFADQTEGISARGGMRLTW
ncbi:autotransporter outer membrane beta-barrel domain-containing protein [Methyloceanibacter sp. wino2]|uniref:autotransporter outer membrane beta-barrel domain-containing protein n=1 Tax=Methyloceanibacter sp. wino2 TaxID=2170729 RepID=UPI00131EE8B5|nr:autotransporter outer membrane beta-barrel domain-containing protein [Methyloceanibacter sp. wino2]